MKEFLTCPCGRTVSYEKSTVDRDSLNVSYEDGQFKICLPSPQSKLSSVGISLKNKNLEITFPAKVNDIVSIDVTGLTSILSLPQTLEKKRE